MEKLTERQKKILYLIVKAHIENGEPIGSKYLCETLNNQISSATIRHEMSILSELGYLDQPHTSAGRIPTAKAYRLYVNGILNQKISTKTKKTIDMIFENINGDYEKIRESAGQALSNITGLPSVSLLSHSDETYVKRLELLPMGRRTVLMVLVTSDAIAKSKMCKSGFDLSTDMISQFDRISTKKIIGTELSKFSSHFIQKLAAEAGNIALIPFFNTVYEIITDLNHMELSLKGQEKLIKNEDNAEALKIMEFIARRDAIISVLSNADDPISIVFGDEENKNGPHNSMIVAKHSGGKIGVIGPARMSYENIIPSIAYFAKKLGDIINKAINEME